MKYVAYIGLGLLAVGGIGCAALSELVTPATIDEHAVEYVVEAGVADTDDYDGYPNLEKANRLAAAVKAAYETNTLALEQLQEKNSLDYSLLNEVVIKNLEVAKERESLLFSETGLLSMGLSLAGLGGFTGLLGLSRKRPGDWTEEEVQTALTEAGVESTEKQSQITEIVKGIQNFLDNSEDNKTNAALKAALSAAQSLNTKKTVAEVKTEIS